MALYKALVQMKVLLLLLSHLITFAEKVHVIGNVTLTLFGVTSEHTTSDNLLQNCKPTCPSLGTRVSDSTDNRNITMIIAVVVVVLLMFAAVITAIVWLKSKRNMNATPLPQEESALDDHERETLT